VKRSTPATEAAKRHMARIKAMPCVCCKLLGREQQDKVEVHHIRANGEPRNDFLTIPLCGNDCHQGRNGVEKEKVYLRMLGLSEWGLLAETIKDLW
jgi:Recombination enhancement, RecA-dependent nuclease